MATWVYLASAAQAGQTATISFAQTNHVIYRPAMNSSGNRIARVGDLQPGDRLLLAYRNPPAPPIVHLCARIAPVENPVSGTQVIEQIHQPFAQQLFNAGYNPVAPGIGEVIHLDDVHVCQFPLHGSYLGQNSIRELDPQDAGYRQFCPSCDEGEDLQSEGSTLDQTAAAVQGAVKCLKSQSVPSATPTLPRLFDAYVMIDWSSKSKPATGKDSIWIAWGEWHGRELVRDSANLATRLVAINRLRELLTDFKSRSKRVLVGFDFAFGYPRGFLSKIGRTDWLDLLRYFGTQVQDDDRNRHNRDAFAENCNSQIGGGGPGPFWGCPLSSITQTLTSRRVGIFEFPYHGLDDYRATERQVRSRGVTVQSVWKLNQGVSVGGQTILGLKHLSELRFASGAELSSSIRVWPLETGWSILDESSIIVAEIFPSILEIEEELGELVNDQAQVLTCVGHAATLDGAGQLQNCFSEPVGFDDEMQRVAREEEGWILFS